MTDISAAQDVLSPDVEVLNVPEVAERLGLAITRVHQLVREGQLLAFRREGVLHVPAEFLDDDSVVKGLGGTVTVLRDGGYDETAILRWLFTEDSSLPGTPIAGLRGTRGKEVKRRAQAMSF